MVKLSIELYDSEIDGHIGGQLLNHLCYADDMCLINNNNNNIFGLNTSI